MSNNKEFIYDGKKQSGDEMAAIMEKALATARSDSRFRAAADMLTGEKVLDVGCNAGVLSRILAEKGKDVLGIDILPSAIEIARTFNQVSGTSFESGDLFKMAFTDNSFDCVLFLETIEHVHEPAKFLDEFRRILKPGGCLIVSTPNAVSYINILHQLLIWRKKDQAKFVESLKAEPRNTGTQLDHIFLWDFRTLSRYLVRSGFEYADHKFAGAWPIKKCFGSGEMKFILPLLGPYLTTLVMKVKKPNG
jgi:ubiquinone/menaquinone biosynthesis C-methylase UbiE